MSSYSFAANNTYHSIKCNDHFKSPHIRDMNYYQQEGMNKAHRVIEFPKDIKAGLDSHGFASICKMWYASVTINFNMDPRFTIDAQLGIYEYTSLSFLFSLKLDSDKISLRASYCFGKRICLVWFSGSEEHRICHPAGTVRSLNQF